LQRAEQPLEPPGLAGFEGPEGDVLGTCSYELVLPLAAEGARR
jgi:hypothetical protein